MIYNVVGVALVLIGIGLNRLDIEVYYFDVLLPIIGIAAILKGKE